MRDSIISVVPSRRLFLIDTFGFIFRAYHARARSGAPPMRTSTGRGTEAIYIFNNMLRKLAKQHQPAYMAAIYESKEPTHRSVEFADYKANRAETPPDLLEQIPHVRRLLEAMRVPVLEYQGFEADDVIGTLARSAEKAGCEVVIVSSDKDMLQLVDEHISMLNPAKDDEWYDPEKVKTFMGVRPDQVADLLALCGDTVDNIPGAPGIGKTGAPKLLEQFGSVEALIERAAEVDRKVYRESLQKNAEQIRMSKRLATISTDVPIPFDLESLKASDPDEPLLKAIYREMEFFSLLKELGPSEDARARDYRVIADPEELREWLRPDLPHAIAVLKSAEGEFALDAVGLAHTPGEARAVTAENLGDLKPWLEDPSAIKIGCDMKTTTLELARLGIEARGFQHDILLYAFLLDADPGGVSLEEQARRRLDLKLGASPEQQADITLELFQLLAPAVESRGLRPLYESIDLPLSGVLSRMERTGIRIDHQELHRLSLLMETEIARLTANIHALAGRPFNISSPQQLADVLFDDLALPAPVKYGKGKTRSTAADILEELAIEHEIVRQVLEYRQLTKLKGTYVDALPELIDPQSGRLHTSFNPAGAATGRLSSSNPNLQNIPIRTALGREIRAAFIPREGWKLLVADYSQIELRLLAHFSEDPLLMEAFLNGEDIHTRTASEVLGIAAHAGDSGSATRRQGGELRHRLWHQRLRPVAAVGDFARRGRNVHQELFRALRRGPAVHRPHHRGSAPIGCDAHALRPRAAHPRHQQPQRQRPGVRRKDRGELALAGNRGRPHQAGDDPHRCPPGEHADIAAPCCCRCMTNWFSSVRRRKWRRCRRWSNARWKARAS